MKTLTTAILFLFSLAAIAQDSTTAKPKVTITVCDKDPQKIMISIEGSSKAKLTLTVYSQQDGYILDKTITTDRYNGSLDFSTAVDGEYIVALACRGMETIRKTVRMETVATPQRIARLK